MRLKGQIIKWMCVWAALLTIAGQVPAAIAQRLTEVPEIDTVQLEVDWEAADASFARAGEQVEYSEAQIAAQIADHEIGRGLAQGRISVLVYMDFGNARAADVKHSLETFAQDRQGFLKYEYATVLPNVFNLRDIPEDQVDGLAQLPGVVKVEIDEYHPNVVRLHDSIPLIRGLQSQITGAGYSADGTGVRICIVDTGIDSDHVMYSTRIDTAAGYDFYNDDSNPEDDNGHGSHVAGIAAGGTGLSWDPCGTGSLPLQGVAPNATLIGVKVLNSGGGGFDSDIIAGINYAADQSGSGAQGDVINMSIGTGNFSSGACTHSWAVAANNAASNGVVAIAASGNENNSNSMGSPACGANVIAVGMTWKNDYPTCEDPTTNWNWGICTDFGPQTDEVGCFSNESDFLDVTAPGANIWSASNAAGGGSIAGNSGTSMSCPTVVGLAALVLDLDPSLTPAEVRQIIRDGAIDMGPAGFDRAYGYGRIDVLNTLALVGTGCTGDGQCDDGIYCNGAETCVAGSCQGGTAVDCNDGVGCTDDSCNEGTDSCDNIANNGNCDNGQWCDGAETCDAVSDCQAGSAPSCNDGVGCTTDSCNEGTDSCDNVPSDGLCSDGQYCNGDETCDPVLDCQSGTAPDCDDSVVCTTDLCNEGTDTCDNTPDDGGCDDGQFCNGAETCHATLGCQAGGDPCPGQLCDEGSNSCFDCQINGDCSDGIFCNGEEQCVAGSCQAGSAVNCDDGVGCTDDSCNEATDSCDNTANNANCDNGLWCDGAESCDAGLDCQAGTAPNCDDSVGCTTDQCDEGSDSCTHTPNNVACDDGVFCNGSESCDVASDCQAGTAPSCDDGVGCTDDSCNTGTDSCDNVVNDGNCDDGQFCNGAETCSAILDCQAGSDPCPGQSCDEGTDTCQAVECVDAGDCDDGNGCTTDTCVGNSCVNDCPGMVSSYPYSEDFEAGLGGWTNASGDVFDWTRDAGGTPSSNTGPSVDHTTGSASGFYMYIETSSPRATGDTAILEGPCLDLTLSSTVDLSFWYHMYGANIGTLDVEVSNDCSAWTNVWTLSGDQGNTWFNANVSLDAFAGSVVKVRFVGTRGASWNSDIAIDDVSIDASGVACSSNPECDDGDACTVDSCVTNLCQNAPINCDDGNGCTDDSCSGGVCSSTCPALVSSFPDSEDYEAGFGDWSNVGGDNIDWTRNSGGTPSNGTGPSGDHTTGSGWYMYIESSSPNYPTMSAILEGPCVDLTSSSTASLSFWYHMLGSDVGTLYMEVSDDCSAWTTEWSLSGTQGSAWQQATVDLSAWSGSIVTIRFRGVTGASWQGDICIDDLQLDATGGPVCTVPADCDDGLYCNGAEDCVAGNCVAGTAPNCDDGVGCTDDSCNEGTDSCDNTTNNSNCDNGLFCDGSETCDAVLDCQSGTAIDCDDGVGCTVDACNEGTDACDNSPNNGACDNGSFCDGAETCDPVFDCVAGSTVDCDDNIPCTDDSCNEGTDQCDNTTNDGNCDDGLYCNGDEMCDAVQGCLAGSDPCDDGVGCTIDDCDEGADSCSNTADDASCDNGLFCDGAETCDPVLDCQTGSDPCPGESCDEASDTCSSGPSAQMETGTVSIGAAGATVNLINSYVSPVIVCSINYSNNTIPVVTRVGSITSSSFDVWLQNAGTGGVATDTVHYIVVEEGSWTIDGVSIDAQTYTSTLTDENNSWVGEAQAYGQAFTNPVVLGQVMSDNDADWSVFWDMGSSRTAPPSSTAFRTGKSVAEDPVVARADETVGFIVIEQGHGSIGGVEYEAALGVDLVRGVGNSPPYTYSFSSAFGATPSIAIVTMAAMDGNNGGWAYTYGASPMSASQLDLVIDEDTINDSERAHTPEQVGYAVFGSSLVYP